MHLKPGTLCLVIAVARLPSIWVGRTCTFVCWGAPAGYFMPDQRCDCTVEFADLPSPAGFGFPSRALLPIDGWDAEDELALDVQNELAVMS